MLSVSLGSRRCWPRTARRRESSRALQKKSGQLPARSLGGAPREGAGSPCAAGEHRGHRRQGAAKPLAARGPAKARKSQG